jgi:hypothetical protein
VKAKPETRDDHWVKEEKDRMKPVEAYCQEVLEMIKVTVQGMETKNERG